MSQTGELGAIERKGRFLHFESRSYKPPCKGTLVGDPKEIDHEPFK